MFNDLGDRSLRASGQRGLGADLLLQREPESHSDAAVCGAQPRSCRHYHLDR
jgi:hypothetical protein